MASDEKSAVIVVLLSVGHSLPPGYYAFVRYASQGKAGEAYFSLLPSRLEELFLRLPYDLRYTLRCLTLTQICTEIPAINQNNDLSALTSLLILMASIPRKQILRVIFLNAFFSRVQDNALPVALVLWWLQGESIIFHLSSFFLHRWVWWLLSFLHIGAWGLFFSLSCLNIWLIV